MANTTYRYLHAHDKWLLDRARERDRIAAAELYRRYRIYTRSVALDTGVPRADVEDIAAEAWARVLASLTNGAGPVTNFRGYLASTVRHVAIDHWRRAHRVVPTDDVEGVLNASAAISSVPGPDAEVDESDADLLAAARAALSRLSPAQRRLLTASLAPGYLGTHAAQLDGTSPAALANRLSRARKALRRAYRPPD